MLWHVQQIFIHLVMPKVDNQVRFQLFSYLFYVLYKVSIFSYVDMDVYAFIGGIYLK
jgi:hypothetical protein